MTPRGVIPKGVVSPSNVDLLSADKASSFLSDDDNNPFNEMFADSIA